MTIYGISSKETGQSHNKKSEQKVNSSEVFDINIHNKAQSHIPSYLDQSASNINQIKHSSSLIALNEIINKDKAKNIVALRGKEILSYLKELLVSIVSGTLAKEHLHNLKYTLQKQEADFEEIELASILDEIKLRAEIEIAKIENSTSNN